MSYVSLVNQACADKAEFFCRMRDFICKNNGTYDYSAAGIGMILHDAVYATDEDNPALDDYIVIKIIGENGKESMYIKLTWSSGYITNGGYRYWDNTTHTGTYLYGSGNALKLDETGTPTISIWGDLDFVTIGETTNDATNDYMSFFGLLNNTAYISTPSLLQSAAAAGTDVVVSLDDIQADWAIGSNLYFIDSESANWEIATISDIGASSITVTLTNSYSVGALVKGEANYVSNTSYTAMYSACVSKRSSAANFAALTVMTVGGYVYTDPDQLNDDHILFPFVCYDSEGYYGSIPHMYQSGGVAEASVGDVIESQDGKQFRLFKYYSNVYIWIREV